MNEEYLVLQVGYEKIERKDEAGKPAKLTVLQLSWLERYTDNVEVGSSTLPGTTLRYGGLAQLARASALHAEGQRFESVILHRVELMLEKEKRKIIFNFPFSIFNSERSLTCCTFSKVKKKSKLSKYQSGAQSAR